MKQLNVIGLDQKHSEQLAERLNQLLANYQIFYMNVRGFHWNIKGKEFFELHAKFEETYNELLLKVDEIAERVLTLGQRPLHAYSTYIEASEIQESKDIHDGKACVREILDSYKVTIRLQREILELASEAGDEGTSSLMSDYIKEQEKTAWMLTSYLS
ncbi:MULTISPECIES: Dps family protein [Idiomarinaceae]|uniref:Dps family protein n=1 Tax=Pseudidiomarina sp. PP-1MA TaxID=3237706 RepID=A0AB39X7P9_9GAMM|nr:MULTISPECIES: Dps family protein [Idiomarina]MDX1525983.1 Dps family protein [Pseudidiomarina maritima]MRJ42615.1 DNA starvation/stationary phase protection protein [Idiomarina sp. FeN1]NCU57965.1 DNA starvation/stationary phase protection protein [Idiomarina sp. FenA--70]NCU60517.1 DNA starvation/stationary phase protection protein [Idiomarina sp. FenBw--71]UUN13606.1 DNA starvation/stationary phase protection protein [Idiomarina loihiensis]